MIRFEHVGTERQIATVAQLADAIWREHYPAIISNEQIDYMIDRFQSTSAIAQQIAEGYHYALILEDDEPTGYLALQCDPGNRELFLSKIYVQKKRRGKGAGHAAIHYISEQAQKNGCNSVWLTVNKMNETAIAAYERWGFQITEEVVADIGHGFVMDDYRMELRLD
jgi:GNAT superfamily N-acetyltransferase